MTSPQQLQTLAAQMNVSLTPEQAQRLLHYLALLQKWNRVYNLSAIRDPETMLVKHILDSLAVVPSVAKWHPNSLIDVGTGAGLPGIPLAIVFPNLKIALLDSNVKKTRFLVQAKAELGLGNVEVCHQRVEDHQCQYDIVISRAFTALDNFVRLTDTLLTEKGVWLAMKSQNLNEELTALPEVYRVQHTQALQIPQLDAQRCVVTLTRQGDGAHG